ncbi:hypothetical protein BO71DRAFT_459585 [Aspergillus ellipticus CBS 707.79]|uniref:Uncharacterized protein n=1 Tax=Aspergillus ellipticus CBS 707.79 TaxID=1448320 RepID=A0A319DB71_9EURO|nr:hypothetical protein BO71DRAFT_459585 [Aspergillus ellipticus CBS 707.79]
MASDPSAADGSKQDTHIHRVLTAGRCTGGFPVGRLRAPCPCNQGVFNATFQPSADDASSLADGGISEPNVVDVTRTKCSHSLSTHRDSELGLSAEASGSSGGPVKQHVEDLTVRE